MLKDNTVRNSILAGLVGIGFSLLARYLERKYLESPEQPTEKNEGSG